ncbi:MAG: ATP-binding protein [Candidatus Lokiarchaeota archaeon]|nr:ATP-binding protein [Candidatus Harpocratesius repetitus]
MERYNPWWIGEEDENFQNWQQKQIKWIPDIIEKITLEPFSLHFLTGPRQVGKTTTIKILIHNLLENGENPHNILYYPCDELINFQELGEILDNFISRQISRNSSITIIILDEITFVKEWWRAIKSRIDQNLFKKSILIITGSSSIELLKEKERFPGRRGNGQDYLLLPLSFQEYTSLFLKDLVISSFNSSLTVEQIIQPNLIYKNRIQALFQDYLKTGGFPIPIQNFFNLKKIQMSTKRTYLDWIRGDLLKFKKNETYMKEIFKYLLESRVSPISWLSISKNTSINSPHTVNAYIETLENLYLLNILYLISPEKQIKYRKNKKIHFIDPFIVKILSEYTNSTVLSENLVESIVASHFSRIYPTFYWKNHSEVDVVLLIDSILIGFEIKWGPKRWKKPIHLKKVSVLEKDTIPLFLASIKWH